MINHEVPGYIMKDPEDYWNSFDLSWCIMKHHEISQSPMGKSFRVSWRTIICQDFMVTFLRGRAKRCSLPHRVWWTLHYFCELKAVVSGIVISLYWCLGKLNKPAASVKSLNQAFRISDIPTPCNQRSPQINNEISNYFGQISRSFVN